MAETIPRFGEADWLAAVETALRGKPISSLQSATFDGIPIDPLYAGVMDHPIAGRLPTLPWVVSSRVDHPDPEAANRLALEDLNGGSSGLSLVPRGSTQSFGFGPDLTDSAALQSVLKDIRTDWITLRLEPSAGGKHTAEALRIYLNDSGQDPSEGTVSFGLDPIGNLAAFGDLSDDWSIVRTRLAESVTRLRGDGYSGSLMEADARPYHASGATEAQELAAVLATAVSYLRAADDAGLALEEIAGNIGVSIAVDAEQFLGIAKIRALRRVWASLLDHCGLSDTPLRVHADTAWRMMTKRDPQVNILRGTIAGFAAGIGGADSVTVLPYTQPLGLPDEFARRIARNCQTILIEESNLHRVSDPAAGSGYVQAMSDAIAEEAWSAFQEIERQGGIVKSLQTGHLQGTIAEAGENRRKAFADGKRVLTGTSAFANLSEVVPTTLDAPTYFRTAKEGASVLVEPLPSRRDAEAFEALRDRSDAMAMETGSAPYVFLASIGSAAEYTARTTWAKSFFESGGILGLSPADDATDDALAEAFRKSGAALACLCSTDGIYAERGAAIAAALKSAGAARIYVAGRPGENADILKSAGVTGFIYQGCPVVETLQTIYDSLADAEQDA